MLGGWARRNVVWGSVWVMRGLGSVDVKDGLVSGRKRRFSDII